jgi:hypothetical protein
MTWADYVIFPLYGYGKSYKNYATLVAIKMVNALSLLE